MEVWQNTREIAGKTLGNWILLQLRAPAPNTRAIGAFVEIDIAGRKITREITIGGGHAGGDIGDIHIGLGDAEDALIRVLWPDGTTGEWQRVKSNQRLTLSP